MVSANSLAANQPSGVIKPSEPVVGYIATAGGINKSKKENKERKT
jgi:hypothetical protein